MQALTTVLKHFCENASIYLYFVICELTFIAGNKKETL